MPPDCRRKSTLARTALQHQTSWLGFSYLRKEDAVKLAPVLAQEYQRRGRPGDHLSGELIHSITQCVFQGQDSYRLTYVADNQRWILDNSMIEHDITAHLDAPYRKSYVLRVCKGSGRTYVVASDRRITALAHEPKKTFS